MDEFIRPATANDLASIHAIFYENEVAGVADPPTAATARGS